MRPARLGLARLALACGCALAAGCSYVQSFLQPYLAPPVARAGYVDPRLEFTAADAAAIDPGSLASAKRLASRRHPPAREIAEYELEIALDGAVLSRTVVQITPLPDGLDLVRHPIPGESPGDPAEMEASVGIAGAISVVRWRGVLGVDRKKPRTAARIVGVEGEPFGVSAAAWTIGIDRQRGATSYKTCNAVGTADAASVHASFTGRAVRYRCATDEVGFVEWLWFVESLQRYFPGGASVPNEGEVLHRIVEVRYRTPE